MVRQQNPSKYSPLHLVRDVGTHTWLWQHSALYYLLQRWYGSWQIKRGPKVSYNQYLVDLLGDPDGKPAKYAKNLLGRLIDHHKKNETPFGIVLFPSFYGPMAEYKLGFLHKMVLEVCEEKEVMCLDLTDKYTDTPYKKLWANAFDPHPSRLAHKIAADAIYDFFGPTWKAGRLTKKQQLSQLETQDNTHKENTK